MKKSKKKGNRLGISDSPGEIGKNYPFLFTKGKRLKTLTNILDPESLYDPKRKKGRSLQNLTDYREFIKKR